MNKTTFLILGTAFVALVADAEPRPDLVTKVQSGELKEARASWWGFDKEDSRYDVAGIPGFLFLSKEKAWVCP